MEMKCFNFFIYGVDWEKKKHNLNVENYILFRDIVIDYSPETASQITLRNCCTEVMEDPG